MAAERLTMRRVKDILRLVFMLQRSQQDVAASIGCGKTTVREYIARARGAGLLEWAAMEALDEAELERLLGFHRVGRGQTRPLPDWAHIHRELRRSHVTLALLWDEYRQQHPDGYGYTQFCEYYRRWVRKLSVVMRQTHRAGEKTFVDYCDGLPLYDRATGKAITTQLFVGVLGASSYTFAEASLTQELPNWLLSHVHMYEHFGGVSELTVPDNLRSGVNHACYYEPEINPSYQDLATHYGTCILPARVRKPRDKAKVEVAVLVAQRWILAALRDRRFYSLADMNEAIAILLDKLNDRKMRHLAKSRREIFEEIDRPALKPLPAVPYELAEWKKATVNIDYHVEYEHSYYSAPYTLAQEHVMVRATALIVEIYLKGRRVASHLRTYKRGDYKTEPAHMPAHHRQRLEWPPSRIVSWAGTIGAATESMVKKILETRKHPEQGYRASLGIIRLANKYSPSRLEAACQRAVAIGAFSYTVVNRMLERGMDRVAPRTETNNRLPLLAGENTRGKEYYN